MCKVYMNKCIPHFMENRKDLGYFWLGYVRMQGQARTLHKIQFCEWYFVSEPLKKNCVSVLV